MIETPHILVTEPQHYASLHLVVPVAEIGTAMGPGIQEVLAAVAAQDATPTGPWFTHHLVRPTVNFDLEICVPVAAPIVEAGRVKPGVWPAMKVARSVFSGSYAGLPGAWGELEAWVKEHSTRPGTQFWEVYLVNPNSNPDPAEWRTELNWPLLD